MPAFPPSSTLVIILAMAFVAPCLRPASAAEEGRLPYRPPVFTDSGRVDRVRSLAAEVDQLFRDFTTEAHFPGLAYGVIVDDTLVLSGGHGFADLSRKIPATPRTVFRIASMTKSFTAVSILRLRDAGRLDLDRPLSRYLPEIRRLPLLTADSPSITPRHLLTHGGGFPEDNPWGDRQLADSDQALVDLVGKPARFANAPGIAYEYSNLGFALLGRLVRRVSHQTCQAYITAHILEPLGMSTTYWDYRRVPADVLAHGYRWQDGEWLEESMLGDGSYGPMGGLLSTVEDFSHYVRFHLSAWPPRDDAETGPLRRASLREMQEPWRISGFDTQATASDGSPCPLVTAYGYGLGWTEDCQHRIRVGHTGGLPGFGSQWRILPEYGIGVVTFANLTYARLSALNTKVVERLLQKAALQPRQLPASDILRQRADALTRLLPGWEGAEGLGIFAENFFADYPIESLKKQARELFEKIGPIQSVGELRPENQLRGTFPLTGPNGALEVFFTLTPENPPLIQEFRLHEAPVAGPAR